MVQDSTGMWEVSPTPASEAAGSLGPGELPQARSAPLPSHEDEPWRAATAGSRSRAAEHATGRIVDTVA